jgi:hypothetical protein
VSKIALDTFGKKRQIPHSKEAEMTAENRSPNTPLQRVFCLSKGAYIFLNPMVLFFYNLQNNSNPFQ